MNSTLTIQQLHNAIRDVPNFPKQGIVFKDITPLLADQKLLDFAVENLVQLCLKHTDSVDKVVAIDARGFIFGALAAAKLNAGFVPVRKKGKLPWKTYAKDYQLEYGEATVEIHQDAILPGERVVLIDDLLATGGTAAAAVKLLAELGSTPVCIAFFIELGFLNGREKFTNFAVESVLNY